MVEYISNISGYGGNYINFVSTYFPEEYRDFSYKDGKKDLPDQMYSLLRNGLVHNFSFLPRVPPMGKAKCSNQGCKFFALVKVSLVKKMGPPHCPNHGVMEMEPSPPQGRERSILITHRSEREGHHLKPVTVDPNGKEADAALFVLEDFCYDLAGVIRKVFAEAEGDTKKKNKITRNWEKYPPVDWLGTLPQAEQTG
jgi:hypothetical protein